MAASVSDVVEGRGRGRGRGSKVSGERKGGAVEGTILGGRITVPGYGNKPGRVSYPTWPL